VLLPSSTLPQVMNLRAELVSNWPADGAAGGAKLVVVVMMLVIGSKCWGLVLDFVGPNSFGQVE
jgi:hypothetical protein